MMFGKAEKLGVHQRLWPVKGAKESRGEEACGPFLA